MKINKKNYTIKKIIQDDDDFKLLDILFNEKSNKWIHNYQNFIEQTYPKSFKCLEFLISLNQPFNVEQLLKKSFQENNQKWVFHFFEAFEKLKNGLNENPFASNIITNQMNIVDNFDYDSFLNSEKQMWKIVFPQIKDYTHMLVSKIFEKKDYKLLEKLEFFCHDFHVPFPIKKIIEQSFIYDKIEILKSFQKYISQKMLDGDELTDIITTIGLTGNVKNFEFFIQKIMPFKNFNNYQKSLVFNGFLLTNYTELCEYLIQKHDFTFYPKEKNLYEEFIDMRRISWEDTEENTESSRNLLLLINNLFNKYHWDKLLLKKEIQEFPNLKNILTKIMFNEELENQLMAQQTQRQKIKI
jgi:hypothetical protein